MTLIATERAGVYLVESSSRPGYFHVLSGCGTPFISHVAIICQAAMAGHDCRHVDEALGIVVPPESRWTRSRLYAIERRLMEQKCPDCGNRYSTVRSNVDGQYVCVQCGVPREVAHGDGGELQPGESSAGRPPAVSVWAGATVPIYHGFNGPEPEESMETEEQES